MKFMKFIQAELVRIEWEDRAHRGSEVHTVIWVPVELKVKAGDTLSDGHNTWTVDIVYPLITEEREGGSPWKRKNQ